MAAGGRKERHCTPVAAAAPRQLGHCRRRADGALVCQLQQRGGRSTGRLHRCIRSPSLLTALLDMYRSTG
jgi:hypothetical protein